MINSTPRKHHRFFIKSVDITFVAPVLPQDNKVYDRYRNKGSRRRCHYSMQEKFDVIEQCDEAIVGEAFPTISTPTQYFQYYYRNPDASHK